MNHQSLNRSDVKDLTDAELQEVQQDLLELDEYAGHGAIVGLPLVGYQCNAQLSEIYAEMQRRGLT